LIATTTSRALRSSLSAALLSSLLLTPALAAAQNPYEAEQDELAAAVARTRGAAAYVPFLELWRTFGDVPPARSIATLERLSRDRRLSAPLRAYVGAFLARAQLRAGDEAASSRTIDELGYVRAFRVVGPFDNEGERGFTTVYDPERLRMEPADPDAHFEGRERPVSWRTYPDIGHYGYVSFDAVHRPDVHACSYAETFVTSERAQPLSLWLGAGGAVAAWWNGTEVLRDDNYRQPDPDRQVAMVGAHAGLNRLLVKVCVETSTWGFYARLGDATGGPARGLTFSTDGDAAQVHAGHGVARLPNAPVAPLAALESAASGASPTAEALENLSRFLVLTGADDPDEDRAPELAERAATLGPTAERWVLAATVASSRGAASTAVDRAVALDDAAAAVLLARARLLMTGPSPDAALAVLDRIPTNSVEAMEGAVLRSELLVALGLPASARSVIDAAAARAPGSARWTAMRARAAEEAGARDEAIARLEEAVAIRFDDQSSRESLILDAITRGETERALSGIEAMLRLGNDHSRFYLRAAELYDAVERSDESMGAFRTAMDLAPDDADVRVAYGRALLRAGQDEVALEVLREALALRPTDVGTRELLEGMEPAERRDEAFAVSSEELLSRVREESGYPLRFLEQLTVNTVFESGLGSSYHQVATQIVTEDGARSWRTYSIVYDPDVQRVTVRAARVYRNGRILEANDSFEQQLGEPWYRIYYDTRAMVVVFPDLEPGDVVEVRYRIDDVAERNQFDDYYGDMQFFAGDAPIARLDYVLMTPTSRTFYFNEPRLASLRHETREDGDLRIDHFHAEDLPAITTEPNAPGMTEVAPYLHISTYQSWEDVGRWWWGLVHDQLYADESLRRTVHTLVDGVTDVRERVRRIYHWVIENTRYVGLEFGIHGFLPYRVPQIVQRGFGDCKDKASLIYTMLREAGIDARMVLLRTRRNGAINDLPASLSVFDHAIAYVPELDLYLDGTAEFSGIEDFPDMDQGVTVLVVGPDASGEVHAELRRTPVLPPERNHHERTLNITLSADGSGRIRASETIRGSGAAWFRNTFQPTGTREQRLETWFRAVVPGTDVTETHFSHLDDFDTPVSFTFEATAPTLAQRDADGLRIAASVLSDLTRAIARTEHRSMTLDLGATESYVEDRTITLPAGFSVGDLPDGGEARSRYGTVVMRVTAEGREVTAHTELSIAVDTVPPAEYAAFRIWVTAADAILRQRITLSRGAR